MIGQNFKLIARVRFYQPMSSVYRRVAPDLAIEQIINETILLTLHRRLSARDCSNRDIGSIKHLNAICRQSQMVEYTSNKELARKQAKPVSIVTLVRYWLVLFANCCISVGSSRFGWDANLQFFIVVGNYGYQQQAYLAQAGHLLAQRQFEFCFVVGCYAIANASSSFARADTSQRR